MAAFFLSVHVLAAIVLIGPMTAAASLFPRYARLAAADPEASGPHAVARLLRRVSRGYAIPALVVPVFGVATAAQLGVLTDAWLLVSMALTLGAALLLVTRVVPAQTRALAALDIRRGVDLGLAGDGDRGGGDAGGDGRGVERRESGGAVATASRDPLGEAELRRLSMLTGVFALTWAVVVVLMIVRPGSTTGV